MGPYCKFCQTRCFIPLTAETPSPILKAYGPATIAATCAEGQALEREITGYSAADILAQRVA